MRFKFNTTNYRSDKIPLLEVIITNPDNDMKVATPALLDTGAFISVFRYEVADVLDIDFLKYCIILAWFGHRKDVSAKPCIYIFIYLSLL